MMILGHQQAEMAASSGVVITDHTTHCISIVIQFEGESNHYTLTGSQSMQAEVTL
jgi:hypothetical protein